MKLVQLVLAAMTVATLNQASGQEPRLRIYSAADAPMLTTDPNGFILNPRWRGIDSATIPGMKEWCGFRARTAHLGARTLLTTASGQRCLSDDERKLVSLSEASQSLRLGVECVTSSLTGQIRGHVNWFPVTTSGQLVWNGYSEGLTDRDINTDLFSPAPNAVTLNNKGQDRFGGHRPYHTEFYYDETLRPARNKQGFWAMLEAVRKDKDRAKALVDNRFVIMTGLYNADGVHGFHAELHPVYALSMLLSAKPRNGGVQEEWAVMVRNSGSQGDCASGTIPMLISDSATATQPFVVDLGGWMDGGTPTVSLLAQSEIGGTATISAALSRPDSGAPHVLLAFEHPRPKIGQPDYVFLGTIRLQWHGGDTTSWIRRFDDRLPAYKRPELNLTPVPLGATNERVLPLEAPPPRRDLRVYNAAPWPIAPPAESGDCATTVKGECNSGMRWLFGSSGRGWPVLPYAGHFRYPHSHYGRGEGFIAELKNLFYTVGQRKEFRYEMFRTAIKRGDTLLYGKNHYGAAFRWSPYFSPNKIELMAASVTPMFILPGLGVSWLHEPDRTVVQQLRFTSTWGIGALVEAPHVAVFVDRQRLWRFGAYESYWLTNIGVLTPLSFLY